MPNVSFKNIVFLSLILHFIFFIITTLPPFFLSSPKPLPTKYLKVEIEGLPDKTIPELKKIDTKEPIEEKSIPKKEELHPEEEIPEKKEKEESIQIPTPAKPSTPKNSPSIKKSKNIDHKRLDDIFSSLKTMKQKARSTLKGQFPSAGNDTTGEQTTEEILYRNNIWNEIEKNWNLPTYLKKRKLQTKVNIKIDEYGYIISKKFISKSGNDQYDTSTYEAIEAITRFDLPHEKLVYKLKTEGINITFEP